jgi:cobalamin synthase
VFFGSLGRVFLIVFWLVLPYICMRFAGLTGDGFGCIVDVSLTSFLANW